MKFEKAKAVVVNASDLPPDVLDWCVDNDISTHYEESLVRIWRNTTPETTNPLFMWLVAEGVDMEEFSDKNQFYVAIIGT